MRTSRDVITRRWGDAHGVQGQAPVRRANGHVLTLERGLRLSDEELDRLADRYQTLGLRARGILFESYVQHPVAIEQAVRVMDHRLPRLDLDLDSVEHRANPPAPAVYRRRCANGLQIERSRPLDARWRHGEGCSHG